MSTQIYQLSEVQGGNGGQQLPVFDPSFGDTRRLSLSSLAAWLQGHLILGRREANTQYAAPAATGFSVAINNTTFDTHLILTPTAGFAAGTIILPAASVVRDKQEIEVNSTQAVTALTINPNGATSVVGGPTTLAANAFFKLRFDLPTRNWYRIG